MNTKPTTIKIEGVSIQAVKADLVKGTINLTIALALNDENLALKGDFSFAAFNHTPFDLTLVSRQTKMDDLLKEALQKKKTPLAAGAQ